MRTIFQLLWQTARDLASWIAGALALVAVFLTWGYFHQLFSFADCPSDKPDMSIGSIVLSGFGFTMCETPNSKEQQGRAGTTQ